MPDFLFAPSNFTKFGLLSWQRPRSDVDGSLRRVIAQASIGKRTCRHPVRKSRLETMTARPQAPDAGQQAEIRCLSPTTGLWLLQSQSELLVLGSPKSNERALFSGPGLVCLPLIDVERAKTEGEGQAGPVVELPAPCVP